MQSSQEGVIKEFMDKSFGGQFLYTPKKYKKGEAHREPADLAWVSDDFVCLFYLTSSTRSLEEQIEHNRIQAAGYHRLWSTNKTDYALRGVNKFGDKCFLGYKNIKAYLTILVVSKKCGIHFAKPITNKISNAVIVVPELLIHHIARFGLTIVDLFKIIELNASSSEDTEESFLKLMDCTKEYIELSLIEADPSKKYLSGTINEDFCLIYKHLSMMLKLVNRDDCTQDRSARERAIGFFGDLMLSDYARLATLAESAIKASEPPLFNKSVILKMTGLHYSFVMSTISIGGVGSTDVSLAGERMRNALESESEKTVIGITYANILDANDYLAPINFILPAILRKKQSVVLAEKILEISQNWVRESNLTDTLKIR